MAERILNQLRVVMPDYPTKVLISKERRAKYFKLTDKLPLKYQNEQYRFFPYKNKGMTLFDTKTKEPVIKNPGSAGKERYQVISGNEMFARTHERIRDKVVKSLKEYFSIAISRSITLTEPIRNPVYISMKLYSQYGAANWDVDNLWIYHKCFYDALVDCKVIPNDNVLYVRKGGETEFIPIKEEEKRTMEFIITEVTNSKPPEDYVTLEESTKVPPGEILVETHPGSTTKILMGVGRKKIIYGAAHKAIRAAMFHCLNNFYVAQVDKTVYERYKKFFTCFEEYNVVLGKYNANQ